MGGIFSSGENINEVKIEENWKAYFDKASKTPASEESLRELIVNYNKMCKDFKETDKKLCCNVKQLQCCIQRLLCEKAKNRKEMLEKECMYKKLLCKKLKELQMQKFKKCFIKEMELRHHYNKLVAMKKKQMMSKNHNTGNHHNNNHHNKMKINITAIIPIIITKEYPNYTKNLGPKIAPFLINEIRKRSELAKRRNEELLNRQQVIEVGNSNPFESSESNENFYNIENENRNDNEQDLFDIEIVKKLPDETFQAMKSAEDGNILVFEVSDPRLDQTNNENIHFGGALSSFEEYLPPFTEKIRQSAQFREFENRLRNLSDYFPNFSKQINREQQFGREQSYQRIIPQSQFNEVYVYDESNEKENERKQREREQREREIERNKGYEHPQAFLAEEIYEPSSYERAIYGGYGNFYGNAPNLYNPSNIFGGADFSGVEGNEDYNDNQRFDEEENEEDEENEEENEDENDENEEEDNNEEENEEEENNEENEEENEEEENENEGGGDDNNFSFVTTNFPLGYQTRDGPVTEELLDRYRKEALAKKNTLSEKELNEEINARIFGGMSDIDREVVQMTPQMSSNNKSSQGKKSSQNKKDSNKSTSGEKKSNKSSSDRPKTPEEQEAKVNEKINILTKKLQKEEEKKRKLEEKKQKNEERKRKEQDRKRKQEERERKDKEKQSGQQNQSGQGNNQGNQSGQGNSSVPPLMTSPSNLTKISGGANNYSNPLNSYVRPTNIPVTHHNW